MRYTYKKTLGAISFYKIKPDVGEDAKAQKWNYYGAEDKLGKLEDIEDNKQCEFLVLNEVSKTWKIYSTWLKDYMHVINIVLWEEATRPYMTCWYFDNKHKQHKKIIFIDQYKDTWALTKEELE